MTENPLYREFFALSFYLEPGDLWEQGPLVSPTLVLNFTDVPGLADVRLALENIARENNTFTEFTAQITTLVQEYGLPDRDHPVINLDREPDHEQRMQRITLTRQELIHL